MRLIAAIAILVGANASALAAHIDLRIVRNDRVVAVADSDVLVEKLVALVQSSSVESTSYAVTSDTWAQMTASDSFMHVVFAKGRLVRLPHQDSNAQEQRLIREILLPLPENRWPDHIFVRSGRDVLSVTKFSPIALRDLVSEPDLELLSVEPYKSLNTLLRRQ